MQNLKESPETMEERVLTRIKEVEERLDCQLGVAFHDEATSATIRHRGHELFHAASTMKIPVMMEVFRQAADKKFALSDTLLVDPIFSSMVDGTPFRTEGDTVVENHIGERIPIIDLVRQMMVVSDNLATNLLIDLVTPQKITKGMRQFGAELGYVLRKLQDIKAYEIGVSNRIAPNDLNALLMALENGKVAAPAETETMRGILLDQEFNDLIPKLLPESVRVGHKTGSITGPRHDTGMVYTDSGNYYLTILSSGLKDEEAGEEAIAQLSRLIYDERAKLLK